MSVRFVDVPGARLWSTGTGMGPAMVLLHGGPGMWDYLGPVAAMFEDRQTAIRFDQRGCGRSSGGPPYDVATAVADVEAVRAAWQVERWVVFGHSWGASLALAYALAHPDRTSGLVYVSGTGVDPAWHDVYREERMTRLTPDERRRWEDLRSRLDRASGDDLIRLRREYGALHGRTELADPDRSSELSAWLYSEGFAINTAANQLLGQDANRVLESPVMPERLKALTVPTLVLHGAHDPRPARYAAEVASLIPGADLVVLPDVGHFPRFEAPEQFRVAVAGFLERLRHLPERD